MDGVGKRRNYYDDAFHLMWGRFMERERDGGGRVLEYMKVNKRYPIVACFLVMSFLD